MTPPKDPKVPKVPKVPKDGPGLSRRELLSFWRRAPDSAASPPPALSAPRAPAPAPLPPPQPVREPLRPPGAIFEDLFVDKCTRCGKCVEVCPRGAIFPLGAEYGRAAGSPAVAPRSAPCVVCAGLLCTRACPSGALTRVAVFDVQMGTAVVDVGRCVSYQGRDCAACVNACPVPGALTRDAERHPIVAPSLCIGCGVCENLCPTAEASIVVEAARLIVR